MIAVSSLRNFTEKTDYARNQMAAHESWQEVFSAVVYFNSQKQPEMRNAKTRFLPAESFPPLLQLVELCAAQAEWCAILNADIIVRPHFRQVEERLVERRADCCASWRHQFDPKVGWEPCERVDNGLDFFAAEPPFWAKVYRDIPEELRLGAIQWDSWMAGYFNAFGKRNFFNITSTKTILHPLHGERSYGHAPPPVHFYGQPSMPSDDFR